MFPNIGMKETDDGYDIESYDIDDADDVEVKEGQGYLVFLTDDVESFGLSTSEDTYRGDILEDLKDGWNLIAFSDDFKDNDAISNIWEIKDNSPESVYDFDDVDENMGPFSYIFY